MIGTHAHLVVAEPDLAVEDGEREYVVDEWFGLAGRGWHAEYLFGTETRGAVGWTDGQGTEFCTECRWVDSRV